MVSSLSQKCGNNLSPYQKVQSISLSPAVYLSGKYDTSLGRCVVTYLWPNKSSKLHRKNHCFVLKRFSALQSSPLCLRYSESAILGRTSDFSFQVSLQQLLLYVLCCYRYNDSEGSSEPKQVIRIKKTSGAASPRTPITWASFLGSEEPSLKLLRSAKLQRTNSS